MLLYPHHSSLGADGLDAVYRMQAGEGRLQVTSVDLLPGEAAVVGQLEKLISLTKSPPMISPVIKFTMGLPR